MTLKTTLRLATGAALTAGLFASLPANAYRQEISNDLSRCGPGDGPAVKVTVRGIKSSSGTMTFCLPVPDAGTYAVAVRHDVNGNGDTDLTEDGGGWASRSTSRGCSRRARPSTVRRAMPRGRSSATPAFRWR